jgi:nucleotide-binding universal stress UspA family protein
MDRRMRLVVGYDGSDYAEVALDDLGRAGLPEVAEIVILCVADVFLPPKRVTSNEHDPAWLAAAIKKAHSRATQALKDARATAMTASKRIQAKHPGWHVRAEACADSPAWGVIAKANRWKADLVILGARGHSAERRLFLGSVSQRVVYDSPCSVRVARTGKGKKGSSVRLILGVDGSIGSDLALREVAGRRWPPGSAIRVVTALDSLLPVSFALASLDPEAGARWNRSKMHPGSSVNNMNEAASEMLRDTGLAVSRLVTEGNPKEILVKEAQRWKADCIFVGAKGLRGIKHLLLGGVSAAVTARAPCSVEVVRSKRAHS